jgi:hypothetical protein
MVGRVSGRTRVVRGGSELRRGEGARRAGSSACPWTLRRRGRAFRPGRRCPDGVELRLECRLVGQRGPGRSESDGFRMCPSPSYSHRPMSGAPARVPASVSRAEATPGVPSAPIYRASVWSVTAAKRWSGSCARRSLSTSTACARPAIRFRSPPPWARRSSKSPLPDNESSLRLDRDTSPGSRPIP